VIHHPVHPSFNYWRPEWDAYLVELRAKTDRWSIIADAIKARFPGFDKSKKAARHRYALLFTDRSPLSPKDAPGIAHDSWAELAKHAAARDAMPPPPVDEDAEPVQHTTDRLPPASHAQRPPRGPMMAPHYIPQGHELGGVSTLTGPDGATSAQWAKTRVAGADEPPDAIPESFLLDRASTMKRGDGTTVVQWSSYRADAVDRWESVKAAISSHVAEYVRPAGPADKPEATNSDLVVLYPLGDPHIGMLAWAAEVGQSFDLKIAERELCECMRQMVARSPAADQAIVANLGDFFHAENARQTTPKSGNKLDVDGRSGKVGRVGLSLMRTLVDTALTKHQNVKVRSLPGNHDPEACFWIVEYLRAVYENEPRVVVEDGFSPYQYDAFGRNLFGWHHGDGAKIEALGEIMATDVPQLWGASSFRYIHTGHEHHLRQKELRGVIVETHRTLAGQDAWHYHAGYRSGRSLKALAYHRDYGLESVAVVGVERVRAALPAYQVAA
jgi:hypothetical protein